MNKHEGSMNGTWLPACCSVACLLFSCLPVRYRQAQGRIQHMEFGQEMALHVSLAAQLAQYQGQRQMIAL